MEHPEYRLTYWHLNRGGPIESLWFYCVEDIAERLFEHCRKLPDDERVTFCVEWWTDAGTAVMVAHGPPRKLLSFYGWPANLTVGLSAGNVTLWERAQREAAADSSRIWNADPDGTLGAISP